MGLKRNGQIVVPAGMAKVYAGADLVFSAAPPVPLYQQWADYPDSPVLTEDYPYQAIALRGNGIYTELYYCTQPLYFIAPNYIGSGATVYKRNFNGTSWGAEFSSELQIMYTIEANFDVYTDSTLSVVSFPKTTP